MSEQFGEFKIVKPEDVKFVEPSFIVYYPDMVYANPKILETDLLLVLKGACIFVEIEDSLSPKSIVTKWAGKQLDSGLLAQPILYFVPSQEEAKDPPIADSPCSPPILLPKPMLKALVKNELKPLIEEIIKELQDWRAKCFSLDNFMCILLAYSSPVVCKWLVGEAELGRYAEEGFGLLAKRIEMLNVAKGLGPGKVRISGSIEDLITKEEFKPARVIVLIPLLRSHVLHQKIAEAIADYVINLAKEDIDLFLICTAESKGDAEAVRKLLREKGLKKIEVYSSPRGRLAEESMEVAGKGPSIIVLTGEIPKDVVLKLAEFTASRLNEVKLAVTAWKPDLRIFPDRIRELDIQLREPNLTLRVVALDFMRFEANTQR